MQTLGRPQLSSGEPTGPLIGCTAPSYLSLFIIDPMVTLHSLAALFFSPSLLSFSSYPRFFATIVLDALHLPAALFCSYKNQRDVDAQAEATRRTGTWQVSQLF